jgi:uncharacterized protein (TIGR02246 family)
MLKGCNNRSSAAIAGLFVEDGHVVGFDGSLMNGRAEIQATLEGIFADHPTAAYVGKVREVRFLAPGVAILRGVAGMISPGQAEINSAANAIQTLVAAKRDGQWRVVLYQNTPAQFHDRPELVQQLTEELRQLL